ncbi:hypothetical protein [Cerasicoccus maritimus]|uniref:hypothetical protein n=1 Tax=Cerasicoccus maritimus TaxID=490089 RepID=UPI0028529483|nr:hypothetical protein [Cerasicoccus maritimus]
MKILLPISIAALLGAGCSMTDKTAIEPSDSLLTTYNDNVSMSTKAQQAAYAANQSLVSSGIVFHEHVQKDLGLSPAGVWYPTYDMADGKVPTEGPAPACAKPDPAKAQEACAVTACPVTGETSEKAAEPACAKPEPAKAQEGIDYNMLQRSIKSE